MRKSRMFVIALVLTLSMLAVFTVPGAAHEHREVGDYELTFGWRVEPAIAGQLNGPEVFIAPLGEEHEETMSMEDMEISLEVEVGFGPASRTVAMRQAFGESGHFIADIIPTRPGDYTFRVTGTIGDLEVDETFNSADGMFSSVEPAGDIQFPEPDPAASDLMARIEALEARITELEAALAE